MRAARAALIAGVAIVGQVSVGAGDAIAVAPPGAVLFGLASTALGALLGAANPHLRPLYP